MPLHGLRYPIFMKTTTTDMKALAQQYQDLIDSCSKLIDYVSENRGKLRFKLGTLGSLRCLRGRIKNEMWLHIAPHWDYLPPNLLTGEDFEGRPPQLQ